MTADLVARANRLADRLAESAPDICWPRRAGALEGRLERLITRADSAAGLLAGSGYGEDAARLRREIEGARAVIREAGRS